MPYVIGIILSVCVAWFARVVGLDRDRAFYPTVVIVVALYYVLFAAIDGSVHTVLLESALMTVFVIAAVVGFKTSTWIIVGALAGHGVLDVFHGGLLNNSGVTDKRFVRRGARGNSRRATTSADPSHPIGARRPRPGRSAARGTRATGSVVR